jgi:hypothetical protein
MDLIFAVDCSFGNGEDIREENNYHFHTHTWLNGKCAFDTVVFLRSFASHQIQTCVCSRDRLPGRNVENCQYI